MQISLFVVGDFLVGDDLLLLHQEIEDSVDDGAVDAEDLGSFIAFDDALLD